MNKTIKIVIAIGVMVVTTQAIGYVISKKLIKFSKDALASLDPSPSEESEDTSFVDAGGCRWMQVDADGDDK